jgi:hypothetical protein
VEVGGSSPLTSTEKMQFSRGFCPGWSALGQSVRDPCAHRVLTGLDSGQSQRIEQLQIPSEDQMAAGQLDGDTTKRVGDHQSRSSIPTSDMNAATQST